MKEHQRRENGYEDNMNIIRKIRSEEGQALVEYAIILAIIALAGVTLLGGLSSAINTVFGNIRTILATV